MRILQIIPSLHVGGAERMAALLAQGLHQLGHEVALVSLFDPTQSWLENELRQTDIPLYFLGKKPGLDLRIIPRMARLVARINPDILHTHLHTLKYTLPAAPRHRIIHTLHNLAEHEIERSGQLFQHLAFRAGVEPVAIGQAVAQSIWHTYHLPPKAIIPNGIPTAHFTRQAAARAELRKSLGVPPDTVVFLNAGRLNPQKNQSLLIRAFAQSRPPNAMLWIAGEGEEQPRLAEQIEKAQPGQSIRLLGLRKDMPELMAAADMFVLSSSWEGNPLVVMEAMAAGLGVLATSVGCVPELVTDSTGLLVPPDDVGAMAQALLTLTTTPHLPAMLSKAAAQRAKQHFDASRMTESYDRLYRNQAVMVS